MNFNETLAKQNGKIYIEKGHFTKLKMYKKEKIQWVSKKLNIHNLYKNIPCTTLL